MSTPTEPLSDVPASGKGQWRRRRLRVSKTVVAVVIVGALVIAIAVVAGLLLAIAWPNSDWFPVYQDVLKTSFGALAVGGLGGLAKLIFDRRKAQEAAALDQRKAEQDRVDKLRDRVGYISNLVMVGHDIDTAMFVIRANQSVKSWTDMVNDRIIPAHSRLRDMTNQLLGWEAAGLPVFDGAEGLAEELRGMNTYFASLLAEHEHRKQALGELQLKAEVAEHTSQQNREQLLARI
jgi:hypothetical protein